MARLTWLDMGLVPAALFVCLSILICVKETGHGGFLQVLCLLTAKHRYTIYRDKYFYPSGIFSVPLFPSPTWRQRSILRRDGIALLRFVVATLFYLQYFVAVCTYSSTVTNFWHQFQLAFFLFELRHCNPTPYCGYVDWIGLAQDRDRWRTLMSAVMNFRVP